jgi:26S proteasome regulatory subunit N4
MLVQSHLSLRSPPTQYPLRRQPSEYTSTISSTDPASTSRSSSTQAWISAYSNPTTPSQSDYNFGYCEDRLATNSNCVLSPSEEQQSVFDYNSTRPSHNFNHLRVHVQTPFGSSQDVELMQSDQAVTSSSWNFSNGQLTPTSARSHYRESSLSSLGSAGPASPFNSSTTSHPQVLLPPDSIGEPYYDGLPAVEYHHTFSKPVTPSQTPSQESFLIPPFQGYMNAYNANQQIATIMAVQKQQASGDDESTVVPEYSHSGRPSVASTHESPATPSIGEDYEERKPGESHLFTHGRCANESLLFGYSTDFRSTSSVPKLDRTMSDIYNDELYSPSFTYTSAPSTKSAEGAPIASRLQSDVFTQRLQTANSQHLSVSSQSPLEPPRDSASHFRVGSPLAPTSNSFGSPRIRINSAKQMREQQKAENDARALQQQMQRSSSQQTSPKTISPKDAMLEYHEAEQDAAVPLFSPQASQYRVQTAVARETSQSDLDETTSQQSFGSMATSRRESSSAFSTSSQVAQQQGSPFTFVPPSVSGRLQIPQQYPFVPQQRRQHSNASSLADRATEFSSTLGLMESKSHEYAPEVSDLRKPTGSAADGGTYTCTYHGCTLRFETPAKLQKHKREGHRQVTPMTSGRCGSSEGGMTSAALRDTQAGPHFCKRINPSTGKPCNTAFSRPYDLTRHEDTIHNARKQKVRCHLCTEEKTFSRNDALTRHMRVVHPEVDFPSKSRRRSHD